MQVVKLKTRISKVLNRLFFQLYTKTSIKMHLYCFRYVENFYYSITDIIIYKVSYFIF